MTILSTDIKLRESERMTDTEDGGGRRTLNPIADGVAGNIFPKVSRLDSVYGRVNLRKVYGHVDTATVDTYAGAHLVITDAPDNDRIHVTAFSTASEYDNRTSARDRIESYVIAGPESRMRLYGRQLMGAQALLAYQREEDPLPEIGEVYAVTNESAGVTIAQQFVAIQDIDQEVRVFTDGSGDFRRRVVTLTIGAPLRYEFTGADTPNRYTGTSSTGRLRSTTVADASRYFGIQPLSAVAHMGDLTLDVHSVYTPIVPTTQRETALSLAGIAGARNFASAGVKTPFMIGLLTGAYAQFTCPQRAKPGSVKVRTVWISGGALYGVEVTDNGAGVFPATGQGSGVASGTINYETGAIYVTIAGGPNPLSFRFEVAYTPLVEVSQASHTAAIEVTLATRGTVYTPVLGPLPASGTTMVDYRALGKWYRLTDDGTGKLVGGDAAYGTGTVNYVTGGVIITLGALPDVGSSVLLSWGSPAHYEIKTNDAGTSARFVTTLPDVPVKRATAVVSYFLNGVATTATANLQGIITGTNSVTGTVHHTTGEVVLNFGAKLPDSGTNVSVAYQQVVGATSGDVPTASGTFPARTPTVLAGFPFQAGSLSVTVTVSSTVPRSVIGDEGASAQVVLQDDGLGNLIVPARTMVVGTRSGASMFLTDAATIVGTINYTTGAVSIGGASIPSSGDVWRLGNIGGNVWQHLGGSGSVAATTATYSVIASSVATSDASKIHVVALDDAQLQIDLTRTTGRMIVAGSVLFTLAGKTYFDRNGTLYTDMNPSTGAALAAGSINYDTGVVDLTLWAANTTIAMAVQSCLTQYGEFTATSAFFRVVGSPIRSASLYVQVTATDGTLLTGLSNTSGVIAGTYMRGVVEQTMGVVRVEFGQMVTAAGNETEPWYDAANVIGAQVWKPKEVQPGTLRYSAVVLSNLPLNADILGLDPVRLPSDGRVPIYRPADVVVVHNTLSINAGTPTSNQVINVGRTGLSSIWLEDANKLKLAGALYAADLTTGLVTMAAGLSLTGYVTPIYVKHRIEEMGLLSDVQINGQLSITAPLLRDYPLGSYVSSALLFGDMFARVTGVFDQGTWTSVWSNTLIGTQATAQYNDVDYPIEVSNAAAVSDRWRINFTSASAFQVISENMGVIATGTTAADLAPLNPLTGLAYFTLRAGGWGLGRAVGNQLRFNTVGAVAPIWLARTVLPGATLAGDSFDAQLRGDVD